MLNISIIITKVRKKFIIFALKHKNIELWEKYYRVFSLLSKIPKEG